MQLPAARSKTILSNKNAGFVRTAARFSLRIAWVAVFLIALWPSGLLAQEPTTDDDEVVKVNTDLLVYPIRVRDKRRPAASSLTDRDLTLKDDDHVTAGLYLYPGADRVALVFALDESGSLREIVSEQRAAALALFGRFGERSSVAVMRFAEQPELVVPFGRDTTTAGEAFRFPVKPNQHTAIFDAAAAAVRAFDTLPRVRSERRIVILISDGLDNASSTKASAAIQAALAKQISFYVIHMPLFAPRDGHLAVRPPTKGFRDLAEKTGGKYFLVGNVSSALSLPANRSGNDLTPIFLAIEEDLRSQYLLGFYAGEASRDGRIHRFKVSLPAGVEYQVASYRYSQSHEFFVKMSVLQAIK
jgi:Ca-activated chloride channel family protein